MAVQINPIEIPIEMDEFLGLSALTLVNNVVNMGKDDVVGTAKTLMHNALATKLDEFGLPWSPSSETARKRAAKAAEPDGALRALMKNERVRDYAISVLVVAALVVLWGGYTQGWKWTGFQAKPAPKQLWDWLNLLLLPVAVGTIPLWIQHPGHISRASRVTYTAVIAAFTGLVIAGYMIPLNWTGFPGNTLWDWFALVLVPVAVASVRLVPSAVRSMRPYEKGIIVFIASGWIVTIIGGYGLGWSWTGYHGNTLFDWLNLLLCPLLVPILVPIALKRLSGNAAQRAQVTRTSGLNLDPSAGFGWRLDGSAAG